MYCRSINDVTVVEHLLYHMLLEIVERLQERAVDESMKRVSLVSPYVTF